MRAMVQVNSQYDIGGNRQGYRELRVFGDCGASSRVEGADSLVQDGRSWLRRVTADCRELYMRSGTLGPACVTVPLRRAEGRRWSGSGRPGAHRASAVRYRGSGTCTSDAGGEEFLVCWQ